MYRFRAAIFDLDGTLVDTLDDILASLNHALRQAGLATVTRDQARASVGGGVGRLIEKTVEEPRIRGEVEDHFREHYGRHLLEKSRLYPGAKEALEALDAIPKAVLSNKPAAMVHKILKGLKIDGYFRAALGGDSMPVKKPDPAVAGKVLTHLGAAPVETLMVGDSRYDLETARNAGLRVCAVTWGYSSGDELKGADYTIRAFSELPAILRG